MKAVQFVILTMMAILTGSPGLAQEALLPPGATYCVAIVPVDGRPCVWTPQWNEWQIRMYAKIEVCYVSNQGENTSTTLSTTVTWYRKFYGSETYQFWKTTNTLEELGSDGHRCPGDPVHYTWQTTYKAVVNIQGKDYAGYLTVGGPPAEFYPCCPGQNCSPPTPPSCP